MAYSDDGTDPADNSFFATDRVLVQDTGFSNAYGHVYYSNYRVGGLHAFSISSSQLTSTGLTLIIATGTHIGTVAIRCTGGLSAPTVADTATTVAANSSANAIPLSITGGAATLVTVATNPAHGTATVSGTSISYTPAAGYSGSDSFTYTASNTSGTSAAATVAITVSAPSLTFTPSAGTLPAGTVNAAYSQTITASGGTAPYSYAVTSGALPAGLALNPSTGTISGTPSVNGLFAVTVTATDANNAASAASYSMAVGVQAPVANAVTTTVAANSSANAIPLSITGGAATLVTVATNPAHGTATVSGTSISYTPAAGYSGSDSFTYTASNTSGTSAAATVAITVSAPSLTFAPSAGTLPAGTVNAAYSQTITASGGTAPYSYAVTSGALPSGLALNPSTGTISGTPSANGLFAVTVTATDANNAASAASYSMAVGVQAPVANAVTTTVAANSSANAIPLSITGGAATLVTVATNPAHGTATVSGTSISYTPAAGYSGSDSFTYTASNTSGTSAAATVAITVSAPSLTFAPSAGTLPAGTVNAAYSQTISASGGTAPYSYAVTSGALPSGLALNPSTGTISGTPSANGLFAVTVTATDANNAAGAASYSMAIKAVTSFVFTPAGGALKEAMVGEDYSQSILAKGGTGALVYTLASGTLPKGVSLNVSTGELTGPLDMDAEPKDYAFVVQVRDQAGVVGTASFTLGVKARAVTVDDKTVNVAEGAAPNNVDLTRGATGGPFTAADLVSVEPPSAGTVTIVRGEFAQATTPTQLGWYLKFIPNPAYSGQVSVRFRLTSALGNSNTGTVTYSIAYNAAEVATEIDGLVHDFVRTRQSLIASTIKVPGLLDRRRMSQSTDPVTARVTPSENGMTLSFATSLAQMETARDNADGISSGAPGGYVSPFNIWIDGAFLVHNERDANANKWGRFAMLNLGADYLLSEKALLGLSFHYDHMTDPTNADAQLTGNGWLAGPYASVEIGRNVFWNASVLYGGSSNDIDTQFWDGAFETRRLLADTSIEGQWELGNETILTPKLRALYFSEDVKDYTVKNSAGDAITIDGFNEEQFRVSLGAEIARSFTLEDGSKLKPRLGVTGGFSGLDGSGAFGSLTAGIALQTTDMWMLDASLLFNLEGDGTRSLGAKVAASKRF